MILDLSNYIAVADRLRTVLAGGFHASHLLSGRYLQLDPEDTKGGDPVIAWENHGHAEIHVHSTYGIHILAQSDEIEFLSDRVVIAKNKNNRLVARQSWTWLLPAS